MIVSDFPDGEEIERRLVTSARSLHELDGHKVGMIESVGRVVGTPLYTSSDSERELARCEQSVQTRALLRRAIDGRWYECLLMGFAKGEYLMLTQYLEGRESDGDYK